MSQPLWPIPLDFKGVEVHGRFVLQAKLLKTWRRQRIRLGNGTGYWGYGMLTVLGKPQDRFCDGRSPQVNKRCGRDHWPKGSCALLAGGGMRTGQVVGATNRLGEYAKQRPVHFQVVHATLYHNLGIDPQQVTVTDLAGRPHYLVDRRHRPMPELV